jgi:hypothetical protein
MTTDKFNGVGNYKISLGAFLTLKLMVLLI